jgi:hypothetical protein
MSKEVNEKEFMDWYIGQLEKRLEEQTNRQIDLMWGESVNMNEFVGLNKYMPNEPELHEALHELGSYHDGARGGFFIGLVVASFFWVAVVGVILVMWLG